MRGAPLYVALCLLLFPGAAAAATAPGAPGQRALWTEADKDGFGTAQDARSKVWHTLDDGRLTEVYYPDLGTPAVRDLQLAVSDGQTVEREASATRQRVKLLDPRSLSYRQVNTDRDGLYRIIKTYTTDPARSTVLIRVRFENLSGHRLRAFVLHDPALSNDGDDDSAATRDGALVAWDAKAAAALVSSDGLRDPSNGFLGTRPPRSASRTTAPGRATSCSPRGCRWTAVATAS